MNMILRNYSWKTENHIVLLLMIFSNVSFIVYYHTCTELSKCIQRLKYSFHLIVNKMKYFDTTYGLQFNCIYIFLSSRILLPGGSVDLITSYYGKAAKIMFELAKQVNYWTIQMHKNNYKINQNNFVSILYFVKWIEYVWLIMYLSFLAI